MAKLAGRWIKVYIEDASAGDRDVSSDVNSVDVPLEFDELDITGFQDAVKNSMPGLPGTNLEITGKFNPTATTGLYTVLNDIVGDFASHTITIQVGTNAAPTGGEPEFEGEFWLPKIGVSVTPTGAVEITASFRVYGTVVPAWGTV